MKELDSFTVERLEELSTKENIPEVAALARIALAAKRAEGLPGNIYPDISGEITALEKILKWILNLEVPTTGATNRAILLGNTIELLRDCQKPIVATPQLNSPEIPDGWNGTLETAAKLIDLCRTYTILGDSGSYKERTINDCELTMQEIESYLAAAPEKENG